MHFYKFLQIQNIISYLKTFFNILKIYLEMDRRKKNKFIVFYFPLRAYNKNIIEIEQELRKIKKIKSFFLYNEKSKSEISNYSNSFFLDFGYLKYIPFSDFFLKKINIFISAYVNYVFPPNSKNIYICHDISDVPMVNKNLERKIFLSLSKMHFIFLSSKTVVDYFKSKFEKYVSNQSRIPNLINTGYLKLDNVIANLKKNKNHNNTILIAPTYSLQMKQFNLTKSLNNIIQNLTKLDHKVIYRPHPLDLTDKGNNEFVKYISKKFSKSKNFSVDLSTSYLKSYSEAKLLITDFSGTAYTFAYSTLKPVIFFSKNENKFKKNKDSKLSYFKDRNKIGLISTNIKSLVKNVYKISKNQKKITRKIFRLRKKRIKYINMSLEITTKFIKRIVK